MTDTDIIQFTPCTETDSKAHSSEMQREYEEIVQLTPVPTQESDGTENCGLEDIKLLELPPVEEMEEILKFEEAEETPLLTPPRAPTMPINVSHGDGTFYINPRNGILGFYIGEKNLQDIIDARIKALVKVSNPEPTT